jgi:hypothetical protein
LTLKLISFPKIRHLWTEVETRVGFFASEAAAYALTPEGQRSSPGGHPANSGGEFFTDSRAFVQGRVAGPE